MRLASAASVPAASMLYLQPPGRVLIDKGIDGLSHDTALDIAGLATSDFFWDLVQRVAHSAGPDWRVTVDCLASARNTRAPRFFARLAEPDAEAEDAFAVPSAPNAIVELDVARPAASQPLWCRPSYQSQLV
jgi:hypothetical protein